MRHISRRAQTIEGQEKRENHETPYEGTAASGRNRRRKKGKELLAGDLVERGKLRRMKRLL